MLDSKIELLQNVPLFIGLSEEQLSAIADASQKTFFEAGDNLITEGETGDTAYLILTGKAGCPKFENGELLEQDLWPGTLIGEIAMLVETIHNVSVTAKERLRALAITARCFALGDGRASRTRTAYIRKAAGAPSQSCGRSAQSGWLSRRIREGRTRYGCVAASLAHKPASRRLSKEYLPLSLIAAREISILGAVI